MLDLDHLRTPVIFKASHYIDQIKLGCQIYIHKNYEDRQLTFREMKNKCEEMLLFCQKEFSKEYKEIQFFIKKIESEIDKLKLINKETELDRCKVCNNEIIIVKTSIKKDKMTYCNNCPKNISDCLLEIEKLTGAIWI